MWDRALCMTRLRFATGLRSQRPLKHGQRAARVIYRRREFHGPDDCVLGDRSQFGNHRRRDDPARAISFVLFGARPSVAVFAGGVLIVAGGLVMLLPPSA
jgi:hypothetical protein